MLQPPLLHKGRNPVTLGRRSRIGVDANFSLPAAGPSPNVAVIGAVVRAYLEAV